MGLFLEGTYVYSAIFSVSTGKRGEVLAIINLL